MEDRDYSQLPVMAGDSLKGAITWESIGKKLAKSPDSKLVSDCVVEAKEVSIDTSLLEAVTLIEYAAYVLVRGKDERIAGIVTASDIAVQFKQHAEAFLAIREIELRLRRLIRRKFNRKELKETASGRREKQRIKGPDDLTVGNFCSLFEDAERWGRLKLNVCHDCFSKSLDSVRIIRNSVMHFNPNGLAPEDLETLRQFVISLRDLVTEG